ncbi:MAG: RNA polymerase sigma factor [Acidobacteriota bacterium]|jgi:RNA polymerase sigma-70 factor (ECF subfamily)
MKTADPVTDERLIELMVAYQRGELDAFEGLFDALAVSVRNYLASLARSADRADDLLQETFLQVHRSRKTYAPPRPVKPWVFGIARNVFLMDRRSRGRKAKHETLAKEELPELPVTALAEDLPVTDELLAALRELPDDRREAVLLHHVHGFSFKEIGAMLGITGRAAKLRSFRGIQALREQFGEGGEQ